MDLSTKWRLVLGEEGTKGEGFSLDGDFQGIDQTLGQLYGEERSAGLGSSAPAVNRWLGDIRKYFPKQVVQMMQKDAIERLNLKQLLLEPEVLETIEADINLVGTLISLNRVIPNKTKETARIVVRKVVDELMKKLENPTKQAIKGSLNRAVRNYRPKQSEINWDKTIRLNLKHYQEEYQTVIPERLVGFGRKGQSLKDIILCVDQSGSMASSVVYSSIFGAVMASIPSVSCRMVVFDTVVTDLTEKMNDPVDLLFGTQLGGGTDINKALGYCREFIRQPSDTVFVLITDLYEGGNSDEMLKKIYNIKMSGVQIVVLLALDDQGTPSFDKRNSQKIAAMDVPCFACTPDLFPDMMATAISKHDIKQWAHKHDILVK